MHPMLNIAVKAARRAGNLIHRSTDKIDHLTITKKSHADFVSEVDRAAEQTIIQTLLDAYPDHAILAEESGAQGESDFVWIIDPLDGTTNFLPRMDLQALRDGYRNLMAALYAPRAYYRRVRILLREFHPPSMGLHFDLMALGAMLRSAVGLGVLGRERMQYWQLLAWTCCRRPRLLPLAVRLAIYGHHFRRCAAALAK